MSVTFSKVLTTSLTVLVLLFNQAFVSDSNNAFASGASRSGGTGGAASIPAPRRSPQEDRLDRLFNQGRKVFRSKISCNQGCLVAENVISDDNAADFLVSIHNQPRFKEALNNDELQAVSVYMLRRYDIKIE